MDRLTEYFSGDELAASTWKKKYALKDKDKNILEDTPDDMHRRLATEFANLNQQRHYQNNIDNEKWNKLSNYGRHRDNLDTTSIYHLFKNFKQIIPQGSIMDILGNPFKIGSLSNCVVVGQPSDSYGGIMQKDEELAQLMKRRCGAGIDISSLRPRKALVTNAAGSSTGAVSFMHRFSHTTREVGQDDRRGALMITCDSRHPELLDFINIKVDLTTVTGANISVQLRDEFMEAVEKDTDYILRWPCEGTFTVSQKEYDEAEYTVFKRDKITGETTIVDNLYEVHHADGTFYWKKIKAREAFDIFVENNWISAEPGAMFVDRHWNYSPDGVYPKYRGRTSNPCGEIFMGAFDACRLLAMNLLCAVDNPYTSKAKLNLDTLYKVAYEQQWLADILVDLELQSIKKIISKIDSDPEPAETKRVEKELWTKLYDVCKSGRRTGCGPVGLGDMLAALGLKYDSDEAIEVIGKVFKTKMMAELDCTIDMAILFGPFEGWNPDEEFFIVGDDQNGYIPLQGRNAFFDMLLVEFPEQSRRMMFNGRRNVSWSTCAPTGTVAMMTQTTGGIEPLFSLEPHYRKRKINPNDTTSRVDVIDANGDKWMEFPVFHHQIIEWYKAILNEDGGNFTTLEVKSMLDNMPKETFESLLQDSPWSGSTANDIDWLKRVGIQAVIQKYTSHSISSTINLPKDVNPGVIKNIYLHAWKMGLKGVTVYRDTCRDGVLTRSSVKESKSKFPYYNSPERPKVLEAELTTVISKGNKYAVVVGLMEGKPYEVFAFIVPKETGDYKKLPGSITKNGKGHYTFEGDHLKMEKMELATEYIQEAYLCRLISMMLRHGAHIEDVVEQANKVEFTVASFPKAIQRVLKLYIKDGDIEGTCPACHEGKLIFQEGCKKCDSCSYSAC